MKKMEFDEGLYDSRAILILTTSVSPQKCSPSLNPSLPDSNLPNPLQTLCQELGLVSHVPHLVMEGLLQNLIEARCHHLSNFKYCYSLVPIYRAKPLESPWYIQGSFRQLASQLKPQNWISSLSSAPTQASCYPLSC